MKAEDLRYEADGLDMVGRLTWDETADGPRPGVLVFPEAFGLGDHAIEKAEQITREFGYAALACDLHGGRGMIGLPAIGEALAPLRAEAVRVRARTVKALEALAARPEVDAARLAAIGFCFGGTMAFELALSGAELRAAVGFHSGLKVTSPHDAGQIKGKVMALLGADDPGIPAQMRDEFGAWLGAAGVDWQMTVYGGVVHGFTNPAVDSLGITERLRYDAVADARSWRQMAGLFEEVLG
jgi:dienelactone hydrolase